MESKGIPKFRKQLEGCQQSSYFQLQHRATKEYNGWELHSTAEGQESTGDEQEGLQGFKPEGEGKTNESDGRVNHLNSQCLANKPPRQRFNNCLIG